MLKVKLLRPLDGKPEGDTAEYPKIDADRLADRGVVEIVGPADEPKDAPQPDDKAEQAAASKPAPRSRKKAG